MNKATLHILGWNEWCLEFLRIAQPSFAKVMVPQAHNDMMLKRARELSPNTQWICRLYRDKQILDRPAYDAGVHAGLMLPYWEYYDLFEGYNEPEAYNAEACKRLNEFEVAFARFVHERGKKNIAFNWGNGWPRFEDWPYLAQALLETDYVGIHSYGWPFLSEPGQNGQGLSLRHRLIWDRIWHFGKPIILTEFGFTNAVIGGPDIGWWTWDIHPQGAREYKCIEELAWFADRLQEDPYLLAACYFTTGRTLGDQWETHDWTPKIYKTIAGYNPQAQPREEAKMDKLPPLKEGLIHALDVSAWGGEIKESQWKAAHDIGFRLAIAQAWGGIPGGRGKNKHCQQQLAAAREAGMMTAIYFYLPADTTTQTHLLIPVVKEAAGTEYEYVKFVAVDIEGDQPLHPIDPAARLKDAISHIKDKPVAIYTSRHKWNGIVMGGVSGFEQYPLWDARYDRLAELDTNWVPYGGWKQRAIKQYQGTTMIPGNISVDLNVVSLERLFPPTEPDTNQAILNDLGVTRATLKAGETALHTAIDIAIKRIEAAEEKLLHK